MNIMKGIKVLLAVALFFVMCGCCSVARGEKLLTLEEIWQDGATWQEVMSCGDEFTFFNYYIDGSFEYDGKTYLKVFWNNRGTEEFIFGLNAEGSILTFALELPIPAPNAGEMISFPYCDFSKLKVGECYVTSGLLFKTDTKEAYIYDMESPVMKSKLSMPCPDRSDRCLEIYSSEDDVYNKWNPYKTKLVVSGLGYVGGWSPMVFPYANTSLPGCNYAEETLFFRDGEGREIYRHPHYDLVMSRVSGIKNIAKDKEESMTLYTISGNKVMTEVTPEHVSRLPKGIYIIKNGDRTPRILIR